MRQDYLSTPHIGLCTARMAIVSLALLSPVAGRGSVGPAAPRDLRVEHLRNPLGIDTLQPRLAWFVTDARRGVVQTAYRILVSSSRAKLAAGAGDLWDSGKVNSGQSIQVAYQGKPLDSGQRCWWKVRTWTRAAGSAPVASPWPEAAWWEMGLLAPEDWAGKNGPSRWIASPKAPALGDGKDLSTRPPASLFRKTFEVRGSVRRARAYVCGLGYYELYLNGRKVGEHVLDPAQTDYDKRAFYVASDVTGLLRQGSTQSAF